MEIYNHKLNSNYKLYESDIKSDTNLKIKQKTIFLANINVKDKIICYEDLIVMGDINAEYLLVSGNLIVSGKMNVKEIDIEGSLICSDGEQFENLNVDGEIIPINKFKNNKNDINIDEIEIRNLKQNSKLLSQVSDLKSKIIKEICDNESDYFLEKIYNTFKMLEDVFVEFKYYNEFISLLLVKYRNPLRCDMNLINYLKIVNYKSELPRWLLNLEPIELTLNNFDNLDIKNMIVDLDNETEINEIKYIIYKCKDKLENKFNEILLMLEKNNEEENELTLDNLYKKYVEQGSTYNIIEGRIKSIEKNRVVLYIEDKVDAILTDYYDIGDKSSYKIDDKIYVCILNVFKVKDKLEIDVYRNSKKCMYESISKLNISSLKTLKKSNIEIVNGEELFITNYIGKKEEIESIEDIIKNKLLLKNIKILSISNSSIENICKVFDVNIDNIIEENKNEYTVKVFDIENYRSKNRLTIKYKDLLQNIDIKNVTVNMISIKTKYNLYTNKINKLIEGKVKEKNDNEYIIYIESNVIGKLRRINANKEYNIDETVISKIESISLGENYIHLNLNNIYDDYIKDLLEYKIKEANAQNMIEKVEIDINDDKLYNIELLLNEIYDKNIIDKLKKEINDSTDKSKILFTILNRDNKNNLSNQLKEIKNGNISNGNSDRDITIWEITKMFNKKKRECGVPEIRIIKNARINRYKTVILSSKLTLTNNKIKLLSLEYDMESELKGEKVKIVIYDEDITTIVSDMLEIEKNDVEVDKNKRHIKINIEQKLYDNLNIANEKTLLSSILPYYKIDFIIKNDILNKTDIISKESEKQENIDDDILELLFK